MAEIKDLESEKRKRILGEIAEMEEAMGFIATDIILKEFGVDEPDLLICDSSNMDMGYEKRED